MRSWMKKLNISLIQMLRSESESSSGWTMTVRVECVECMKIIVGIDSAWWHQSDLVTCSHGKMIVLRCQHYKPQSLVNNILTLLTLPAQYWSIGVKSGSPRWWPVLPMCCWSQSKEAVSKHPVISCQPTHCPGYLWYQCQHTEPDFLW